MHQIYDNIGIQHKSSTDILRIFTEHMCCKYDHITIDDECVRGITDCGLRKIPPAANEALEEPITMDELLQTIKKGKAMKAPGRDGICLEFFEETWEFTKQDVLAVVNNTYIDGQITDQQKHGVLLCIPKNSDPERIEDYRPLTLLHSDYKLLTEIIANRMGPWMTDIIQKSQHCGPHGNTILDAAASVRDVVAYAEIRGLLEKYPTVFFYANT